MINSQIINNLLVKVLFIKITQLLKFRSKEELLKGLQKIYLCKRSKVY
jgi:hypothetical protein